MNSFVITPYDVFISISKLKDSLSRTPEQIPATYIKNISRSLSKPLSILYNQILSNTEIPKIWKHAIVTPIFKSGNKSSVLNYRPISLTSVFCRILESILKHKICKYLLQYNIVSYTQHGFLSGRSTATQQLAYFSQVTNFLENFKACDAILIDFSKAFDKISHFKLIQVLSLYKIDQKLINWIKCWLTNRSQQTIVDNCLSRSCSVTSGVPQGSVLGPLLFILYIESLIKQLNNFSKHIEVFAYADDIKILSYNKHDLQAALTITENWAKTWDLEINPNKSIHVKFFSGYKSSSNTNTYFLNNKIIQTCQTVKI